MKSQVMSSIRRTQSSGTLHPKTRQIDLRATADSLFEDDLCNQGEPWTRQRKPEGIFYKEIKL